MPRVTMLYHAHTRGPAGCEREELDLPERVDPAAIRAAVAARHPALAAFLPACRVAHNLDFVRDEVHLSDGDELALIPPVSGG